MSIADATTEKAAYDTKMVNAASAPIESSRAVSAYMQKVIEVLTALETSVDAQSDALDALEARIEALEA